MYQVIKRDGHVAEFSLNRISSAIMKAFDATHIPYAPDVIDLLSLQVTADYADKIRDGRIDVETIQDSVEAVLQRAGYAEVAKAYILYRKNREKLRNIELHHSGLQKAGGRLSAGVRLAGKGKLHRHLLRGRIDPVQLRRHHSQLLAQRDL